MNAHGEILLKPCPEIADAGNRLDFRIPTVTDSKLDFAQLLAGTHKEKLRFCIVYLESVGDHPSSNFSCTSSDKCSERIMLRRLASGAECDKIGRKKSIYLQSQQPRGHSPRFRLHCYNGGLRGEAYFLKKTSLRTVYFKGSSMTYLNINL